MRPIEDIRLTGAAWVTEAELSMLCDFAKRAKVAEAEVTKCHQMLQGAWSLMSPEDGKRLGIEAVLCSCQRSQCEGEAL